MKRIVPKDQKIKKEDGVVETSLGRAENV